MRLLLDTQILVWLSIDFERLPREAIRLIEDNSNSLVFSVVSIWEVAIKRNLGKGRLGIEPAALRVGLLDLGFRELSILGDHVIATRLLPPLHKDPFDRLLVTQGMVEDLTLLTTDAQLARYPGPIRRI